MNQHKNISIEFVKYIIAGASQVFFDLALMYILTDIFEIFYIYSTAAVYIIILIYGFLMNKYWTFESMGKIHSEMFKFSVLVAFNFFFVMFAMWLLVDGLYLHYLLAKLIVIIIITFWNFIAYKFFVYR